jgi:hypothetical protein
MIVSPPMIFVYVDSYHTWSVIHVTYIWVFMIPNMSVFIEVRHGSEMEMDASTLEDYLKCP